MSDWYLGRLSEGMPVLVAAETGGPPEGFASFGPFREGGAYAPTVEHSVYVAREARRRGVATLLMRELVQQARGRGLSRMIGCVSGDRADSIAFHERMGFHRCGSLPSIGLKHGRRLDLVLMVLALD